MTELDDGGPAFPTATSERVWDVGMSLRDYFAGQALASVPVTPGLVDELLVKRAQWAYRQADAMLAARKAEL